MLCLRVSLVCFPQTATLSPRRAPPSEFDFKRPSIATFFATLPPPPGSPGWLSGVGFPISIFPCHFGRRNRHSVYEHPSDGVRWFLSSQEVARGSLSDCLGAPAAYKGAPGSSKLQKWGHLCVAFRLLDFRSLNRRSVISNNFSIFQRVFVTQGMAFRNFSGANLEPRRPSFFYLGVRG